MEEEREREREEGLVDEGVVEADEAEDQCLVVGGRGGVDGEGDGREVEEDDGREGGLDGADVWGGGADVEGGLGDEDGDGERWIEL
ncbi:hypothetical protein MRB53_030099 [Persea americana]|uniref:Uncharacterized protein n=1 Tax=Persea americana TaxID=3435 RepID=A0ACC2KKA9_PERAE|nr:hypothetical protein MRB53_030099 [Persea americana]